MAKQDAIYFQPDVDRLDWNEARQAAHLNVPQIAEKAGIGVSTLYAWLNGSQPMTVERVKAIEKVIDREGMFTVGLDDETTDKTSPAASEAEPVDERELVTASPSADAPVAEADDASAAGEPTLDGATTTPEPGVRPSDVGEFAAMWNAWDDEHRAKWLDQVKKNADTAGHCLGEGHADFAHRLDRALTAEADANRVRATERDRWKAAEHTLAEEVSRLSTLLATERAAHRSQAEKLNEQLESLGREYHAAMAKPPIPVIPSSLPRLEGRVAHGVMHIRTAPNEGERLDGEWKAPLTDASPTNRETLLRAILDELARRDPHEVNTLLDGMKTLNELEAAIL